MNAGNPMNACGARTRGGGRCKRAPGRTGRCNLHGKEGSGRPPLHGRTSNYARIFGENYRALVNDPEVLKSNAELGLFDTFIAERAELLGDGFSATWLDEVRDALGALRAALFTNPNAQVARSSFLRLEDLTRAGGERVAAWEELLEKAAQRSALASKARGAENHVSESDMVALFSKMLGILADVAGTDTADRVAWRFEREVLPRVSEGAERVSVGQQPN